jgi:hypothetical protein
VSRDGRPAGARSRDHARHTVTLTVRDAAGHKSTVKHKVKVVR